MTLKRRTTKILIIAVYTLGIVGWTDANTIYVDIKANGADDGSSWVDAYVYLQDALLAANALDKPTEVRVAQGVYRPDLGKAVLVGDYEVSFQLINNVTIKGGYAGVGGSTPDSRDIESYETILAGDLLGDDIPVLDPFDLHGERSRLDNSIHVVNGSGTDNSAVLDGVTITGGNAYVQYDPTGDDTRSYGGGMFIFQGSPTLNRCTFRANSSDWLGGAMANMDHASPHVKNCHFVGNGGGYHSDEYRSTAGAVGNVVQSGPIFDACTFVNNAALVGGAMFNYDSQPVMNNCTFSENSAVKYGGAVSNATNSLATFNNCTFTHNNAGFAAAIENNASQIFVNNCVFADNTAEQFGGAIRNLLSANATVTNCTFVNNTAGQAGGVFIGHMNGNATVVNSILRNNGAATGSLAGLKDQCSISFKSCNIEGGQTGVQLHDTCSVDWENNIDLNPQFVDPDRGNYRLKSQAGHWDPIQQSWAQDDVTSPCIDTGDPMSPVGRESFPNGGLVNMGAYGGTAEASRSYFGRPVCETIIAGDINGDCRVDYVDMALMTLRWLEAPPE